jgi:hypothetical protein
MSKVLLIVFFLAGGRIEHQEVEIESLAACYMRSLRAATIIREHGFVPLGIRCVHRMDT